MTFDTVGAIHELRNAQQAYTAQKQRFESIRPVAAIQPVASEAEESQESGASSFRKEFSFSFGKLGVRLEVEGTEESLESLSKAALSRYNKERESAFRTELEIAGLRETLALPVAAEESAETGALSDSSGEQPSRLTTQLAQRAYAEQDRNFEAYPHLPGVSIGVV